MVDIRTELHDQIDQLVTSGISALEQNQLRDALMLFREAYEKNPDDPHACSYFGYTMGIVENKPHRGLELCMKAINTDQIDPMFYHNIAMLYVKIGKKREAVGAFKKGLQIDRSNTKIYEAWKNNLGIRRNPAIPFLPRGNFLNKMIGKWTYKRIKKQGKV